MYYLSYIEIQKVLREIEEGYIHGIKSSSGYADKKYNTTAVFVVRKVRNKLYHKMKSKYE